MKLNPTAYPNFGSLRSARNFLGGYIPQRVVVRNGGRFLIVSPATATRHNLRTLAANFG